MFRWHPGDRGRGRAEGFAGSEGGLRGHLGVAGRIATQIPAGKHDDLALKGIIVAARAH